MAALVAAFANPQFKVFYQRLIAAGKAPKVALVAVMRKLCQGMTSWIISCASSQRSFFSGIPWSRRIRFRSGR
ncbi:MAG: hypothetical protein ABSD58_13830, partial [Verrucomicrobiia bacterium]